MTLTKTSKRSLWLGIIFSIFAVVFTLLYYFKVISSMDLFLAVIYVSYFVGLALLYNGVYNRENNHTKATVINFLLGMIFVIASTVMLIYGFSTGMISLI